MNSVRLDRWLWAARQYRTRALAVQAIGAGAVRLNDRRVKPGAAVKIDDRIRLRKGPYHYDLVVQNLGERRGRANEAALLYEETAESRAARETRRLQIAHQPVATYEGKGRPTKRDRRRLDRLRERGREP